MTHKTYNLFCPLAMACEIVEPRWTLLILLEMWNGSTRFNEIRRGVPGISPTLLSKRLGEMEAHGLVERIEDPSRGTVDYLRTPMAVELEEAMDSLGEWAHRNMRPEVALKAPDPDYLIWNLRRKIDIAALPQRRVVVRFRLTQDDKPARKYWLIARPGTGVDLCISDPGFDVDLFVEAETKALASVWLGYSSWRSEVSLDRIFLSGDSRLINTIEDWLIKSGYANAAASDKTDLGAVSCPARMIR